MTSLDYFNEGIGSEEKNSEAGLQTVGSSQESNRRFGSILQKV